MDILKDLMEDLKPKGGRLREKLMLEKAFERYEQHRSTLSHETSPYLGACTCMHGRRYADSSTTSMPIHPESKP
jgi:hypothetical protein